MPVDMNQTIADASLNNLHDIMLPDAVGFFPLAPGWYIVLLLFLSLLFHLAYTRYKQYKADQYKRDALVELDQFQVKSKENTITLLLLAKRVGISAYGRDTIAKLHEDAWWDFIERHSQAKVDAALRKEIQTLLYKEDNTFDESAFDAVLSFVTQWITSHKVEKDV